MEKLIELLNEYMEEIAFYDLNEYNEAEILDEETLEVNWKYHDIEYLYTKKFWFIKWLVVNDKIDTDPIRTRVKRVYVELEPREFTPQDFVDRVIMLLSISSSPIDDLISYLK